MKKIALLLISLFIGCLSVFPQMHRVETISVVERDGTEIVLSEDNYIVYIGNSYLYLTKEQGNKIRTISKYKDLVLTSVEYLDCEKSKALCDKGLKDFYVYMADDTHGNIRTVALSVSNIDTNLKYLILENPKDIFSYLMIRKL